MIKFSAPSTVITLLFFSACGEPASPGVDKTTYHYGRDRQGWNDAETVLTPENVASDEFGLMWESEELDDHEGVPARLFASPLYLSDMEFTRSPLSGSRAPVSFVASSTGWTYAILAGENESSPPGTILWRRQLTDNPCDSAKIGILGTPVIDQDKERLYVASCSGDWLWHIHGLDLQTGETVEGWPLEVSPRTVTAELNRNGASAFIDGRPYIQRGALTLNVSGSRLYVTFGPDMQGWLISVDTESPRLVRAFSSMPRAEMEQGGMWGSSGAAIDDEGRIYVATGASFGNALANGGIPSVYPDSDHVWGQSILQFEDDMETGLRLIGTYAPFNYCQTAAADIDIAGSGPVLFNIAKEATSTPHLLALGGGKQGNAYLLDRNNFPGDLIRRQPCSTDPSSDGSLLAPDIQPELNSRGPISVFGPYSDDIGMGNTAKSRSTNAYYRDADGGHYLYLTGTSKTGEDYSINVPPGLVRVEVVPDTDQPAFLHKDKMEMTQTLQNPGSPVISSNEGDNGIVWVLDPNVPRSFDIHLPTAPGARLYAFDAQDLRLLWHSGAELRPSGKYNEPTVVDGMVLVGTDRLQAYGLAEASTHLQPEHVVELDVTDPIGVRLFTAHCGSCHGTTDGERVSRATLALLPREQLILSMTEGTMREFAAGLSAENTDAIADALPDIE